MKAQILCVCELKNIEIKYYSFFFCFLITFHTKREKQKNVLYMYEKVK
jgi:hypothetical protein